MRFKYTTLDGGENEPRYFVSKSLTIAYFFTHQNPEPRGQSRTRELFRLVNRPGIENATAEYT